MDRYQRHAHRLQILVRRRISSGFFAILALGCTDIDEIYKPQSDFGEVARRRLQGDARVFVPEDSTRHFYYDDGFAGNHTTYWSLECRTVEDCHKVLQSFTRFGDVGPWDGSRYRVVMRGPADLDQSILDEYWGRSPN